ncbi:MAG: gluconate:H+ symporter, partial [Saprospiraceae bacterium]|nr:gluconate:H+ symporter [Saprospiraceae bacterium]
MPLLIIALAIGLLLVLVIALRVNAFLALIIVALGVGLAQGMAPVEVVQSIQEGVGSTLGYLALILGLGAMLGGLVADSGGARQITSRLIDSFGIRNIQWAAVLTGFIVGLPLFYTVGFVMLVPVIFTIVRSTGLPLLYVAIPTVASLSVTHGFLPPHPAPTAISVIYEADITLTLLYGLILAVPTIIIAGPIFARTLKKLEASPPEHLFRERELPEKLPSFGLALFTALIPVLLMALAALSKLTLPEENSLRAIASFAGDPVMALLIAVLIAVYTLGTRTGRTMGEVMNSCSEAVQSIAMILLIIGAG